MYYHNSIVSGDDPYEIQNCANVKEICCHMKELLGYTVVNY